VFYKIGKPGMKKLYASGEIKTRYPCQGFRHYFAVTETYLLGLSKAAIDPAVLSALMNLTQTDLIWT
jgi:hypothetical protein